MAAAGTSTVTFTVTEVARIEGAGRLAALAAIEIELDGIALTVQGVRVVRQSNRITTEAPRYRDPRTGQWLPALILRTSSVPRLAASFNGSSWARGARASLPFSTSRSRAALTSGACRAG
jgi:hypothetical protein